MIWSTLLFSTLISMAQREIYTHLPGLCRRMIARQAAKLPARLRSRHEEEWLAHSAQLQGSLRQLFHASSFWTDRAAASITRDDVFEGLAEVGDDLKGFDLQHEELLTGLRVVREKLSGLGLAPIEAAGEQLRQQMRDAINDATSAHKIDLAAALGNLSKSCDSWLAQIQQAVLILRSNLDFTVSELGLQIEEHRSFLSAAHKRESSIRQKLAKCGTHSDFLNIDAALLELRKDLDLYREVGTGSDPSPARLAKDAQTARILAALAEQRTGNPDPVC